MWRRYKVLRQQLDRHVAPEPRVAGAIDLAHSSRTERGEDLVGTEFLTRGESHSAGNLPQFDLYCRAARASLSSMFQIGLSAQRANATSEPDGLAGLRRFRSH